MACLVSGPGAERFADKTLVKLGYFEKPMVGLVTRVGVVPGLHGRGGGTQLLKELIAKAKELCFLMPWRQMRLLRN